MSVKPVLTCGEAKAKLNELCDGWRNNRWIYVQLPRPIEKILEEGLGCEPPKPVRFESLGQLKSQWFWDDAPALIVRGENPRLLYVFDIVRKEIKEGATTRELVVLKVWPIQPAYHYRDMVGIVPLARLG